MMKPSQVSNDNFIEKNGKLNIDDVLDDRGNIYGDFTSHAKFSQEFKRLIQQALFEKTRYLKEVGIATKNRAQIMDADQQEALDMIVHKIARIVNGDPNHIDSWVDIAGYAMLVANRLGKNKN